MTDSRPGWGNAVWFPVAAVVVGLGIGMAVGRGIRTAPPSDDNDGDGKDLRTEVRLPKTVKPVAAPKPAAVPVAVPAAALVPGVGAAIPPAVAAPGAAPAPVAAAPATSPAPGAMSKAHLRSNPDGVDVFRQSDGEKLGVTPFDLDLPESAEALKVVFKKKGYASKTEEIVPRGEVNVSVELAVAKKKPKSISSNTTIDPFN